MPRGHRLNSAIKVVMNEACLNSDAAEPLEGSNPSHTIRSIQYGHNSHQYSGDNGEVKLTPLIIVCSSSNAWLQVIPLAPGDAVLGSGASVEALHSCTTNIGFQTHTY